MKKKTLAHYPSIPSPKIDQFTLYQLSIELFKQKQFTKGLQAFISNCIISTNQPKQTLNKSMTLHNSPKSLTSPISKNKISNKLQQQINKLQKSIDQQRDQQQCEFIFQQQVKNRMLYPWMLNQNGNNQIIQCKVITDQISDVIEQTIQTSLHKILNKQFINVTNEILTMREQINIFTRQELERTQQMKLQMRKQMDNMHKKILQQQHISTSILNQPLERFARSKGVLMNTSQSNNSTKQTILNTKQSSSSKQMDESKLSVHHQIHALKKQIQMLKKNNNPANQSSKMGWGSQSVLHLQEKLSIVQQKLSQITLATKLSYQQQKQKCKKGYEQLSSQLAVTSSKQFISQQVKKSIKSNLKIYLDEIMKCKKDIEQLFERIQRYDKGMQEYLCNQLKNVWTLVSGVKTRLQHVEEQFGVGMDQSFVL